MPEPIGPLYPTQVPLKTEAADIRKALNLYHYGTDTVPTDEASILPDSIAGYIRDVTQAVNDINAGQAVINNLNTDEGLNDVITTGVYNSISSPTTGAPLNYPTTVPGLLIVHNPELGAIFQRYHTNGSTNNIFFRSYNTTTSSWSSWSLVSKDGHTHDTRYYTKDQVDTRVSSSLTANRAVATDNNGTVISTAVTAQEIGFVAGVTSNIQLQIDGKSNLGHTHNDLYYTKSEQPKIYVQSTQPTAASDGDLWFW